MSSRASQQRGRRNQGVQLSAVPQCQVSLLNGREEWKRVGFVIVLKSYIVNKIVFPSFYDAVMKLISQHIAVSPDEVQRAVNILTQLIMKDFNFKT